MEYWSTYYSWLEYKRKYAITTKKEDSSCGFVELIGGFLGFLIVLVIFKFCL